MENKMLVVTTENIPGRKYEVIGDVFDIRSRIITVDGKKVILGGKYYEET